MEQAAVRSVTNLLAEDLAWLEQHARSAIDDRIQRAATSVGDDRSAAGVGFQRRDAEILFARKDQRSAAGVQLLQFGLAISAISHGYRPAARRTPAKRGGANADKSRPAQ